MVDAVPGYGDFLRVARERFGKLADEVLNAGRANREMVEDLIAHEVDRAVTHLGFVRVEELDEVRADLSEVRAELAALRVSLAADRLRESNETDRTPPVKKAPVKKSPAKKTTATTAPAKKAPTKRAPVKEAPISTPVSTSRSDEATTL